MPGQSSDLQNMQSVCDARFCSVRRGHIPYDPREFDIVEPGGNLVIFPQCSRTPRALLGRWGGHQPFHAELSSPLYSKANIGCFPVSTPMRHTSVLVSPYWTLYQKDSRTCMTTGRDTLLAGRVRKHQLRWPHGSLINTISIFTTAGCHDKSNWRVITIPGRRHSTELGMIFVYQELQSWSTLFSLHPPTWDLRRRHTCFLIQNPQDTLSSSVVTFFNLERHTGEPTRQFAITTNEGILLEHLIYGLGLEGRCLSSGSDLNLHSFKRLTTTPFGTSILRRGWHWHHSMDEQKTWATGDSNGQRSHQPATNKCSIATEGREAPNTWAGGLTPMGLSTPQLHPAQSPSSSSMRETTLQSCHPSLKSHGLPMKRQLQLLFWLLECRVRFPSFQMTILCRGGRSRPMKKTSPDIACSSQRTHPLNASSTLCPRQLKRMNCISCAHSTNWALRKQSFWTWSGILRAYLKSPSRNPQGNCCQQNPSRRFCRRGQHD